MGSRRDPCLAARPGSAGKAVRESCSVQVKVMVVDPVIGCGMPYARKPGACNIKASSGPRQLQSRKNRVVCLGPGFVRARNGAGKTPRPQDGENPGRVPLPSRSTQHDRLPRTPPAPLTEGAGYGNHRVDRSGPGCGPGCQHADPRQERARAVTDPQARTSMTRSQVWRSGCRSPTESYFRAGQAGLGEAGRHASCGLRSSASCRTRACRQRSSPAWPAIPAPAPPRSPAAASCGR